jgi:hypothetical protein
MSTLLGATVLYSARLLLTINALVLGSFPRCTSIDVEVADKANELFPLLGDTIF